jgi:hypothetical protein
MAEQTSFFDNEIALLEKERGEVEAELAQLTAGHISLTVGTQVIEMELGSVPLEADEAELKKHLAQALNDNPLVETIARGYMTQQELREELELPPPSKSLIAQNKRLNHKLIKKNSVLGGIAASPLLIIAGMLLLAYWGYNIFTASDNPTSYISPTPSVSPRLTPTPLPQALKVDQEGKQNIRFILKEEGGEAEVTSSPNPSPDNSLVPSPPATFTSNNFEGRVGQPPSEAGGYNGAHGAFLPPHRIQIAPLGLNLLIDRATTQEKDGQLAVVWARGGQVGHIGAYPGETGNMVLLATQSTLGGMRKLQQGDELRLYDRKGNLFIYRLMPFSPTGQVEREIDLLEDGWVFEPTEQAVVTILVSLPQDTPVSTGSALNQGQNTAKDDYLTTKKLAYRAVLAIYAPTIPTPAGTPVAVPNSVWQVRAANTPTPTSLPTATPLPTPTPDPEVQLPGLPNTGDGTCQVVKCEKGGGSP